MKNVTEYDDYKVYLKAVLSSKKQRGFQAQLAKAAHCQGSYLSQIFSGKSHLSTDQALAIATFLDLPEVEREYFLLLVELAKAATAPLKARLNTKLETLRRRNKESVRFFPRNSLPEAEATEYYSSWAYNAVRLCLRVRATRSAEDVATRFGLNLKFATRILESLERMGLAVRTEKGWLRSKASGFSLSWESPMYLVSHMNYRIKAIEENLRGNPSFNFSCTTSLTERGYKEVCAILEKAIADFSKIEDAIDDENRYYMIGIDFLKI